MAARAAATAALATLMLALGGSFQPAAATAAVPTLATVEWVSLPPDTVRFHLRWTNPDPVNSTLSIGGSLLSQFLGAFAYDYLTIGTFHVPALAPGDVHDLYFSEAVDRLPPAPAKSLPYGGPPPGWPCPPDTAWSGSVVVRWDSLGTTFNAPRRVGHLRVDPGAGASLIRVVSHCTVPAAWTIGGPCDGFEVALLGEDKVTPAPDSLPVDWTGYVAVSAPAGTAEGLDCTPVLAVSGGGRADTVRIAATTCAWPGPHAPTLQTIEWAMLAPDTVRFHVRWTNPDPATTSEPTSGFLASQEFGALVGDYLTIGMFDLPALAPGDSRDFYFEQALSGLPPAPSKVLPYGGPPPGWPCPPDTAWSGSVHVHWDSLGTPAGRVRHAGSLTVDPGADASLVHVVTYATAPATWTIAGLCDGFDATLVDNDGTTPASNPLPAGWSGYLAVSATAGTAAGLTCAPQVAMASGGVADTLTLLATTCSWPRPHAPTLETLEWATLVADTVRFHLRWANHDPETSSQPASGTLLSQFLGAFAYDYLTIGTFDLPALAPGESADLYYDAAVNDLPPPPAKVLPYGGPPSGWSCAPDTAWTGSVHVRWDSLGTTAGATRHDGHLLVDPGAGASLVHVVTHCAAPATWAVGGLCDGFAATLLEDDRTTPAPAELPVDWAGYVAISAAAGTGEAATCAPTITVTCGGAMDSLRVYATACAWPMRHAPSLEAIDWAMPARDTVRFHLRWTNPDPVATSEPVGGTVASQEFGGFMGDYLGIGVVDVPALAPGTSHDLYFDKALGSLPPDPAKVLPYGGPPAGWACAPDSTWSGSVHVRWDSLGTSLEATRHLGRLAVDPGAEASCIRVLSTATGPADWTIGGLAVGFAATLVDNDRVTPAPNPLPAGWSGYVAVSAAAGTGDGVTCTAFVALGSDGVADTIRLEAATCAWPGLHAPTLETVDWAMLGSDSVRFHVRWSNPDALTASQPASGSLICQYLGAFAYDYVTVATFDLPALAPETSVDLYYPAAVSSLPPAPPRYEPYGGPSPDWACAPDTGWIGSAHVRWDSLGTAAHATRHLGHLRVDPGAGVSTIRVVTHCAGPATWAVAGSCDGFTATLLGEDRETAAPDSLPVDWSGYVAISAPAGTANGLTCTPEIVVTCGGAADTIHVRATTCFWASAGVEDGTPRADFGIRAVAPNPCRGLTRIAFGLPRATRVQMSLVDVSGKRVRTLVAGELSAGLQSITWDGRTESGEPAAAGVYFLLLRADGRTATRSVVLLR